MARTQGPFDYFPVPGASIEAAADVPDGHSRSLAAIADDLDLDTARTRSATAAYDLAEEIGACETGDDLDNSIAQSSYQINARPLPTAKQYLDGSAQPKLKTCGWAFRNRSNDENNLPGTSLDYYWTKGESSLNVTIWTSDGQEGISMSAVSPCGKLGKTRYGSVQADDPWYIAPTVKGPTVKDDKN